MRGAILHNTDFANADLTGAILDDVRCNRMRITNTKGLKDISKDRLLAGGAYEGLPPTISKAQIVMMEVGGKVKNQWEQFLSNFIQDEANSEKEVLPFQQRLQNQFEEYKKQYLEWQKQQERESERLKKEEDQWQLNREQERLRIIHERQIRDQNRQTDRERRQKSKRYKTSNAAKKRSKKPS